MGKEYRLPNFCVNEPYMEKELCQKDEQREFNQINVILNFG